MYLKFKTKVPRILTDFDGIFGHDMSYNSTEKFAKTFGLGIRHAFELLSIAGFEPPVIITGDATGNGLEISKRFLHNIPHELVAVKSHLKTGYIRRRFEDSSYIWVGEDIYDLDLMNHAAHYITIRENQVQEKYANVTFPQKYFWLSFAEWAIRRYSVLSIMEMQRYICQPDFVQAIHEEIRQLKVRNERAMPTLKIGAADQSTEFKHTYKDVMQGIAAQYGIGGIYNPTEAQINVMIDVLPKDLLLASSPNDLNKYIVVIADPDAMFLKDLLELSEDYHRYQKISHKVIFYYDNVDAAARTEMFLNKSKLYRGIAPKLIKDLTNLEDSFGQVLSDHTIQLKLF